MARPSNKQALASRETGSNKLQIYGGVHSYGINGRLSFIPSLEGMPLLAEMERMWFLDETVGAMAFCIQTTLGQAVWDHVPCIDGREIREKENEDADWAADFCDQLTGDMEHSFEDHIEEAISMIPFGFAPCEIVTRQRNGRDSRYKDGFWGLKKLPLRDQLSIWRWIYDGDTPVAFSQMGAPGSGITPLWKTLHYRASTYLNNPNGRPYLLNVHRAFALKVKMQDSEAIGIERDLCGLPTFRVPEEVIDEANEVDQNGAPTDRALLAQKKLQNAIKAVSDMRFNKSGGLIMPSDTFSEDVEGDRTAKWDFKLITTAGQRSIDVRTAIRDYDRAIARVLMQQFLHLGDRSTGSFALSSDQSDIGVRALQTFANRICAEWNRKVVPLIWSINGFDPRYMPKLKASQLNKDGIAQLGKFLADAARGAELWDTDPVTRAALLQVSNLPFNPANNIEAAESARKRRQNAAAAPQQQQLPFGGGNEE